VRQKNLIERHYVFLLTCLGENEKRVNNLCELLSLRRRSCGR